MSNKNNVPETTEQPSAATTAQVAAFNPFEKLSAEQVTALAGNFNKQWRAAHSLDVALAMTEYSISENDATFFAWLKSEAEAIIDRNTVSDTVKYITSMLNGVAFPNSCDVSLGLIEQRYGSLKVELRKTVGIRVRDYATGKWQSDTAKAIMEKVYNHLKVTEKDWMR